MDEKFMVMEQERIFKEEKRKKNRKKFGIAAAVCLGAVIGGGWYLGWGRYLGAAEESAVQITAINGQEIIYATLTSVKGNEITYVVAQEAQTADEETAQEQIDGGNIEQPTGENAWSQEGKGGRAETDGEKPQMEDGELSQNGELPQDGEMLRGGGRTEIDGEKPQMGDGEPPQDGELPQDDGMSQDSEGSRWRDISDRGEEISGFMDRTTQKGMSSGSVDSFTYNNVIYELTDETVTTMIPVGTDVTTKLGTVTTFSRLAAGDKVALVVEEQDGGQIIVAVYIIG